MILNPLVFACFIVLSFSLFIQDPTLHGFHDLPPFDEGLRHFNWKKYQEYQTNHTWLTTEMLFEVGEFLVPYIEATSRVKGKPPIIPPPKIIIDCQKAHEDFPRRFTGEKLSKPKRIIDFVPLAHELDLLEVRLFELNDTVDHFVILEGTHTHRSQNKPLFLARNMERFSAFRKKIVHIIADDGAQERFVNSSQETVNAWGIENQMRSIMYSKFVDALGDPSFSDLLMHSDLDEIPMRTTLLLFKHCKLDDTKNSMALPAAFQGPFFRYSVNFLATYPNMEIRFPNIVHKGWMKRLPDGGKMLYRGDGATTGPNTAVHFNRFSGSAIDLVYKEAIFAEGGIIDFSYFEKGMRHVYTVIGKTLRSNDFALAWSQTADDSQRKNIPWMMICFPERYPYFWWTPEEANIVVDKIKKGEVPELPTVFSTAQKHSCPNRAKFYIEPKSESLPKFESWKRKNLTEENIGTSQKKENESPEISIEEKPSGIGEATLALNQNSRSLGFESIVFIGIWILLFFYFIFRVIRRRCAAQK